MIDDGRSQRAGPARGEVETLVRTLTGAVVATPHSEKVYMFLKQIEGAAVLLYIRCGAPARRSCLILVSLTQDQPQSRLGKCLFDAVHVNGCRLRIRILQRWNCTQQMPQPGACREALIISNLAATQW